MRWDRNEIALSSKLEANYVSVDKEEFFLKNLDTVSERKVSSTSYLFKLVDPSGETEDRVIKICKSPSQNKYEARIKRFEREIKAFKIASRKKLTYVINFYKASEVEMLGQTYPCFIMEEATFNLTTFLSVNKYKFTISQKLSYCLDILAGLRQLHGADIYHRDIKSDNIVIVNKELKICDLGLVRFQNDDDNIDQTNEKIGPKGWLSPEATNKMLTYKKGGPYNYPCDINYQSDIFQLGKLFWFIFQFNLPVGQILIDDWKEIDKNIYDVIFEMLQYDRERRPTLLDIENRLTPLMHKYTL